MTPGKRFGLSGAQKSDMWRRWKAGQSLHEIGRALGKEHSSIRRVQEKLQGFKLPRVDFMKVLRPPIETAALTRNVESLVLDGTSIVSAGHPQSFEIMKFVSFQGF